MLPGPFLGRFARILHPLHPRSRETESQSHHPREQAGAGTEPDPAPEQFHSIPNLRPLSLRQEGDTGTPGHHPVILWWARKKNPEFQPSSRKTPLPHAHPHPLHPLSLEMLGRGTQSPCTSSQTPTPSPKPSQKWEILDTYPKTNWTQHGAKSSFPGFAASTRHQKLQESMQHKKKGN